MPEITIPLTPNQSLAWDAWKAAFGEQSDPGELLTAALLPALKEEARWRLISANRLPHVQDTITDPAFDAIEYALREHGIEVRWNPDTLRPQIRVPDGNGWTDMDPHQVERDNTQHQLQVAEVRPHIWTRVAGITCGIALAFAVLFLAK